MPYLCIDRHNHKYYKPINPYCKGVRGNWGNVFLIGAGTLLRMGTFSNWVGLMLVDSLWCNGRERRRQTSCLMLDSMRIGSLTPVSLGNERIPCDFSRVLVQPILKNNYYSIYFIFRLV